MSFIKSAKSINRKGDAYIRRHGVKGFDKFAAGLLQDSGLASMFSVEEIIKCSFDQKNQGHQKYRNLEFSDLPITVSHGENCFIDVYFWRRRPTVIHNHHFMGAFMCLFGNNVDLEFSFKKEKKVGKFHETGTLLLEHARNIKPGDVAPIDLLNKFIHQNHHQAELTVNLCFRTPDMGKTNLSNYLYSGLKFEKNPLMLSKALRLRRVIDMGDFDLRDIDVSIDDAICFMLQMSDSSSGNPRLHNAMDFFRKKIKKEASFDIDAYIHEHESKLEELENEYE